jgi:hypothetical protein
MKVSVFRRLPYIWKPCLLLDRAETNSEVCRDLRVARCLQPGHFGLVRQAKGHLNAAWSPHSEEAAALRCRGIRTSGDPER